MKLNVFIQQSRTLSFCPNCHKIGFLKKSRNRNAFEKIAKLFFFRYYSCRNCGWRGVKFKYKIARGGYKAVFLYIIIIIASLFLARFFLSKLF